MVTICILYFEVAAFCTPQLLETRGNGFSLGGVLNDKPWLQESLPFFPLHLSSFLSRIQFSPIEFSMHPPPCPLPAVLVEFSKVVFCRVRTNHTRGHNTPGVTVQRTSVCFVGHSYPVPGTSGNSVRHSYLHPELLDVLYANATNSRVRVYHFITDKGSAWAPAMPAPMLRVGQGSTSTT